MMRALLASAAALAVVSASAPSDTRSLPAVLEEDRAVDALGMISESTAEALGFGAALTSHAFLQRYNRTEFRYTVSTTGGEDLTYFRASVSCDVEPDLLDHSGRWRLGVDKYSDAVGYRHMGLPAEDGSRDLVLAFSGKLGASEQNATVAGPEGWATVLVGGPDCAADRAFVEVAELPDDVEVPCDDDEAVAGAFETPADASDEEVPARCDQERTVRRTLSLASPDGLVTELSFWVRSRDTAAPSFSGIPERVLVECGVDPEPEEPDARDAVSDKCETLGSLSLSDVCSTRRNSSCPASYVSTRTWTATDSCGNTKCHTQSVVRLDTLPPVIDEPADYTVECAGSGSEVPQGSLSDANITDACGDCFDELSFANVTVEGACGLEYAVQRYWTAEDCCGNKATARQVVHVADRTPPELVLAAYNASQECGPAGASPPAVQSTSDACSASAPVFAGPVLVARDSSNACAVRETYGYNATDECWNTREANATITLVDSTAPSISGVPGDVDFVSCDAAELPGAGEPSCTDSCQTGLSPSLSAANTTFPGACPGEYDVTRTWTCSDSCGNDAEQVVQTLRVRDRAPPSFNVTLPGPLTIECDDNSTVVPPASALTAVDACDPDVPSAEANVTVVRVPNADGLTCRFNYTEVRRWVTADCAGNEVRHEQNITHQDSTPPVINVTEAPDAVVSCMDEFVALYPAKACGSDACGNVTVAVCQTVERSGVCRDRAVFTRTYTVTDECGLQAEHVQTVSVRDETPPDFGEPARPDRTDAGGPPLDEPAPAAADTCSGTVASVTNFGGPANATSQFFAWAASDPCGNTAWMNYTVSF